MIIFVIFGSVMAAPVRDTVAGTGSEIFVFAALLLGMTTAFALTGICQCPSKSDRKQYTYIQKRSNMDDSEYFASFSRQRSQSIVRMDSIAVETFPMIPSQRRSY